MHIYIYTHMYTHMYLYIHKCIYIYMYLLYLLCILIVSSKFWCLQILDTPKKSERFSLIISLNSMAKKTPAITLQDRCPPIIIWALNIFKQHSLVRYVYHKPSRGLSCRVERVFCIGRAVRNGTRCLTGIWSNSFLTV